jgi:hypothetical protein
MRCLAVADGDAKTATDEEKELRLRARTICGTRFRHSRTEWSAWPGCASWNWPNWRNCNASRPYNERQSRRDWWNAPSNSAIRETVPFVTHAAIAAVSRWDDEIAQYHRFYCCETIACRKCFQDREARSKRAHAEWTACIQEGSTEESEAKLANVRSLHTCPLCRDQTTRVRETELLLAQAQAGKSWAQYELLTHRYLTGRLDEKV